MRARLTLIVLLPMDFNGKGKGKTRLIVDNVSTNADPLGGPLIAVSSGSAKVARRSPSTGRAIDGRPPITSYFHAR